MTDNYAVLFLNVLQFIIFHISTIKHSIRFKYKQKPWKCLMLWILVICVFLLYHFIFCMFYSSAWLVHYWTAI